MSDTDLLASPGICATPCSTTISPWVGREAKCFLVVTVMGDSSEVEGLCLLFIDTGASFEDSLMLLLLCLFIANAPCGTKRKVTLSLAPEIE